ncbi:MAG TPA: hypothetical protein VGH38_09940 [Bryobacteraceae bacterium]
MTCDECGVRLREVISVAEAVSETFLQRGTRSMPRALVGAASHR